MWNASPPGAVTRTNQMELGSSPPPRRDEKLSSVPSGDLLQAVLGRQVDLVMRNGLHRRLRDRILDEAIYA